MGRSQLDAGLRNPSGQISVKRGSDQSEDKYEKHGPLGDRRILVMCKNMANLLPSWPHHTTTATATASTPALLFPSPLYLWPFNSCRTCSCELGRHSPRRLRPKSPTTIPVARATLTDSISCCYRGRSHVWQKSSCDEYLSRSYVLSNGCHHEQEKLRLQRSRPPSPAIHGARTLSCSTLATSRDDSFATPDRSSLSTAVDRSSGAVDDLHTVPPSCNRAEFVRLLLAAGAVLVAAELASSPKDAAATGAQVDSVAPDGKGLAQECGRSALTGGVADDSDDRDAT